MDQNFCIQCENCYAPDGEKTPWFYLCCFAAAMPSRVNYVTGKREAPYETCQSLRRKYGPDCPMFVAGENNTKSKEKTNGTDC